MSEDWMRAAGWGFAAAAALPIGAAIAMRFSPGTRTVGAIMAFGAGTLISAVTFELVAQAFDRADLWPVVVGLGLGALTFTAGDAAIMRWGGRPHRAMAGPRGETPTAALRSCSAPCSTASRSRWCWASPSRPAGR